MNHYSQSLPMPTRRQQLGRHGRERLIAALKFLGKALALFVGGYLLLTGAFLL